MMPATKESFNPLLKQAETKNLFALSLDFRGHGESTNNGKLDYHNFNEGDHSGYRFDADAAFETATETAPVIGLIGASIGANIALWLQCEKNIPTSVLISPGIDYHGVKTLPLAQKLSSNQSCYIIGSKEVQSGHRYEDDAKTIYEALSTSRKEIKILPSSSHGTTLMEESPELWSLFIDYFEQAASLRG
jgi:esterase/lipase